MEVTSPAHDVLRASLGAAQDEPYSIDFFRLQLEFARKVSALTGIPLAEAVGKGVGQGSQLVKIVEATSCTKPA